VADFFAWMERSDIGALQSIQPVHVAAWVEDLGRRHAVPTVKQHLAAIRTLFDWLVIGQAVRHNPATSVRGPKHVVRNGKTPVLTPEETRLLLDAIPVETIAGRRDRALIGLMVCSFARIGAALSMSVDDVFHMHRRLWVRLHEKGGKHHEMPCHHNLEHYLQDYIDAAGIAEDRKGPLFRTVERGTDRLSNRPLCSRVRCWLRDRCLAIPRRTGTRPTTISCGRPLRQRPSPAACGRPSARCFATAIPISGGRRKRSVSACGHCNVASPGRMKATTTWSTRCGSKPASRCSVTKISDWSISPRSWVTPTKPISPGLSAGGPEWGRAPSGARA
jgi:hypothetical protein